MLLITTTYYWLLATCYLLPTTYDSLLTTHYSLLTTHYSLFTTYNLQPTTYYLLLATYYLLLLTQASRAARNEALSYFRHWFGNLDDFASPNGDVASGQEEGENSIANALQKLRSAANAAKRDTRGIRTHAAKALET